MQQTSSAKQNPLSKTLLSTYKCFRAAAKAWAHLLQVYKKTEEMPTVFPKFSAPSTFLRESRACQSHHTTTTSNAGEATTEQTLAWQIFQVEKGQQTKLPTLNSCHLHQTQLLFSCERCMHFRFVLSPSQQATSNIRAVHFPETLFTKGNIISGIWETSTVEGHNWRDERDRNTSQGWGEATLLSQTSAVGPRETPRQEPPNDLANQLPD